MDEQVVVRTPGELAAALRARRAELGLPLREVGDRASTTLQQVHLVETGRAAPRASTLFQLADALDYDLVLVPREVRQPSEDG